MTGWAGRRNFERAGDLLWVHKHPFLGDDATFAAWQSRSKGGSGAGAAPRLPDRRRAPDGYVRSPASPRGSARTSSNRRSERRCAADRPVGRVGRYLPQGVPGPPSRSRSPCSGDAPICGRRPSTSLSSVRGHARGVSEDDASISQRLRLRECRAAWLPGITVREYRIGSKRVMIDSFQSTSDSG